MLLTDIMLLIAHQASVFLLGGRGHGAQVGAGRPVGRPGAWERRPAVRSSLHILHLSGDASAPGALQALVRTLLISLQLHLHRSTAGSVHH